MEGYIPRKKDHVNRLGDTSWNEQKYNPCPGREARPQGRHRRGVFTRD